MMTNNLEHYRWVFMGSPQIAVDFLESLADRYGCFPSLVITNPDQKVGRKQILTPSSVKAYALEHNIPVVTPISDEELVSALEGYDFACVLAYGSILSSQALETPTHGCLNIHPSLLPEYRGPSPITTAILEDQTQTGVSLMKLVPQMDAGPIIAQSPVDVPQWQKYNIHERDMAQIGARLLHDYFDDYAQQRLFVEEQNHERATYCPKYQKSDMEIDRQDHEYKQYRIYCAFPKPFFMHHGKRIVVTQARYEKNQFIIERVIPEGKVEKAYVSNEFPI